MKTIYIFLLSWLMLGTPLQADAAVTIVECEDQSGGGRSFYKNICPPGTTLVGSQQIATNKVNTRETAGIETKKAVLYTVPECESCEQVREFLQVKEVPFTEKDVADDAALQDELKGITGKLRVPVTVIGEKVIEGYQRQEMKKALNLVD